ncbi:hypothetical protein V6N13_050796 [Hibiscus sabdariffa]|uniref:Uncharacterized protein n=1 Tax=Hibiscus sabdariffa TaxID=183260 RepID=A0ABR2PID0_9ROSI
MDGNASVDPTQDNDDTDHLVSSSILLHGYSDRTNRALFLLRLYFNRRRMDGVEKSVYDLRAELGGGNAPPSVLPDAKYDADAKYDFEPPRYI